MVQYETMSTDQQINIIDGIDRLLKIKGVGDHTRRAIIKDIGILSRDEAGALPCCGRIADALVECVEEPSDRLDRGGSKDPPTNKPL